MTPPPSPPFAPAADVAAARVLREKIAAAEDAHRALVVKWRETEVRIGEERRAEEESVIAAINYLNETGARAGMSVMKIAETANITRNRAARHLKTLGHAGRIARHSRGYAVLP